MSMTRLPLGKRGDLGVLVHRVMVDVEVAMCRILVDDAWLMVDGSIDGAKAF